VQGCLTRTGGFWGNHPAITAQFLPLSSCGISLTTTSANTAGSATEDICFGGKDFKQGKTSPQQLQLIRQCTVAALNIDATMENGGNCLADFPSLASVFTTCCETLCNGGNSPSTIGASGCGTGLKGLSRAVKNAEKTAQKVTGAQAKVDKALQAFNDAVASGDQRAIDKAVRKLQQEQQKLQAAIDLAEAAKAALAQTQ
jgi:hypothetical protein